MKTKKHKCAAEFVSWGIVVLVIGLACFCLAPIVEDLLNGWSFEYDGKLWGLYQFGYAPLGLLNVLQKGIQGLFLFVIQFNEAQAVVNVGGIACLAVLVITLALWVVFFIGSCAKHKGYKSAAIIFILIFGCLGVLGISSYIGSFEYMVKQNGVTSYCCLFSSILLNPEIKVPTLVMSIIGFGGEILGTLLIFIGLLVHIGDTFQKAPAEVKSESANQISQGQSQPHRQNQPYQNGQRPMPQRTNNPNRNYSGQARPQQRFQRSSQGVRRPQQGSRPVQNRPQQLKK